MRNRERLLRDFLSRASLNRKYGKNQLPELKFSDGEVKSLMKESLPGAQLYGIVDKGKVDGRAYYSRGPLSVDQLEPRIKRYVQDRLEKLGYEKPKNNVPRSPTLRTPVNPDWII